MNMAMVIAERSLCERDKVGAVVVSQSNRIIDTGYNGPPAGMMRHGTVSEAGCTMWCPRARQSYENEMQRKRLGDIGAFEAPLHEGYLDCHALHAEANALMFGDRAEREGGTIYISSGVCGGCAKLIANSGLKRVVCDVTHAAPHRSSGEWFAWLELCGITVEEMTH